MGKKRFLIYTGAYMENKKIKATLVIMLLGVVVIITAALAVAWSGTRRLIETSDSAPIRSTVTAGEDLSVANVSLQQFVNLPLDVSGMVKGTWFSEGVFNVQLLDARSRELGNALARSTQNWMTQESIPFSVRIPGVPYHGPATIVFHKANPSGDPSRDDQYRLQVIVK